MKVFVYFNLHKKLFSVKALEGENKGKVVAHLPLVVLSDATPRVSEAGRQRVLKEKQKNVHAGIVGNLSNQNISSDTLYEVISYNPYSYPHFFYKRTLDEWTGAPSVLMFASPNPTVYSIE